jgi:hypothetical protein
MEWIARIQVDAMDNASGAAGYTDFTSITCDLTEGSTVNVILTPGFSGSAYTEYWRIWIDYNDDHDFEDAGEEVFSGSGSTAVTGSFTVASGITVNTRMRVSMKYAGYPTPCETFTYGEVEDYTANIIPPSCLGMLANPGFETGTLAGWTPIGDVSITSDSHTGLYAVSVDGANSSVEQVVIDLCGSTTYTVSCLGKAKSQAGVYLGVKDYGGAEQTVHFTDFKNYVQKSITFTTGPTNTSVTIFFTKSDKKFTGFADDFEIVQN